MAKTNPSPTFPTFPGSAVAVTASDSTTFEPSVIYVGVTGNVRVTTAQQDDVTFTSVPSGYVIPVQVVKVWSTSTTATSMVRIY